MEELNFPVIKEPFPPHPMLTMDRYVKFVQMYVRYILDRKTYEEKKKRSIVNVPFRLK